MAPEERQDRREKIEREERREKREERREKREEGRGKIEVREKERVGEGERARASE